MHLVTCHAHVTYCLYAEMKATIDADGRTHAGVRPAADADRPSFAAFPAEIGEAIVPISRSRRAAPISRSRRAAAAADDSSPSPPPGCRDAAAEPLG